VKESLSRMVILSFKVGIVAGGEEEEGGEAIAGE
jgi:hypothetical protein